MRTPHAWIALVGLMLCGCASPSAVTHHQAAGAIGPYSGRVVLDDLCFVSGKIAPESRAGGAFADEVEAVIDEIAEELRASGLSLGDVVNATAYLTDMSQFAEFNRVYATRFSQPYPARTTVGVAALPAGRRIEIAVIAHVKR